MRKAKQGSVDRITYTRATGLLIQRQRKGKTKKSKEGRQRPLQDLLNHDIHQPSAVQTSYRPVQTHTSWSGLSPRCTAIPVADHTTATNRAGPSISAPTGPWHQNKSRRNSPLLSPNEKLLFHEDHVLQWYPDQQGSGGDIGNGGGHDQPVGCAAVARRLRWGFHLCYDYGKPLHDDEEGHTQACKLQHLAQGELQRPPRAHAVAVQKKKKKGGRRGLLSQWGDPCPSEGWSGLGPVHCLPPLAFSTHHSPGSLLTQLLTLHSALCTLVSRWCGRPFTLFIYRI